MRIIVETESSREISSILWSQGRTNFERLSEEQKNYLIDYLNDYSYEVEFTDTMLNDFFWYDAYYVLEDAGLM